ncbi:MAG: hypothetical protein HY925_11885 [Elusimicrobia bacterium]|nr:hypothetical protein [Elusimicrobiota bacterium]
MLSTLFLLAVAARAEVGEHARLSGILEVPKLFGEVVPNGPPGLKPVNPGSVKIYAQPAKRKWPTPKKIDAPGDVAYEEWGNETPGAVVFRQRKGWYEVKLKDGKGWIDAAEAGKFHALEDLVAGGLAYMTSDWDGEVHEKPEKDSPSKKLEPGGDEYGAQVLSHKRNKDGLWLQVRVLDSTGCEGGEAKELATGWVRAHAANGIVAIWFHSRGC